MPDNIIQQAKVILEELLKREDEWFKQDLCLITKTIEIRGDLTRALIKCNDVLNDNGIATNEP